MNRNENMVAIGLEVGPGLLLQTFGVGHMYAGRYQTGLLIMFGYWMLQAINGLLMSVGIGLITAPLTWLAFMVMCPTNLLGAKRGR